MPRPVHRRLGKRGPIPDLAFVEATNAATGIGQGAAMPTPFPYCRPLRSLAVARLTRFVSPTRGGSERPSTLARPRWRWRRPRSRGRSGPRREGTTAGDAEPIQEAIALQANRPPTIPTGKPTRSANSAKDVACQATTAATCGRTKPIARRT